MRVRLTRQAERQLGAILAYVGEQNPRAADRIAAAMETAFERIARRPQLGRAQDVEGVRRRVVQPGGYLIFYAVDGAEIAILAISHPARRRPYRDA